MSDDRILKHRQELHDAFFLDRDQELLDFLEFEADATEEEGGNSLDSMAGIHIGVIGLTLPATADARAVLETATTGDINMFTVDIS